MTDTVLVAPDTVWLPVGIVRRAHGIRGELRVGLHNPEDYLPSDLKHVCLRLPDGESRFVRVQGIRPTSGGVVLMALEGVGDRDVAQALAGAEVHVSASDLPPLPDDNAYLAELLGAEAIDAETGDVLGTIRRIFSNGAQDVVAIDGPAGERLLPWTPSTFVDFDRAHRRVRLRVVPGLWE